MAIDCCVKPIEVVIYVVEYLIIDTNDVGMFNGVKNEFRNIKIWFLASATASNRLLYDANRLLGFENVIFHFCLSANRLLFDANRLHCLKNVILAPGTASNRLLSSANRLLTVCRFWKLQKFITFDP